MKLISDRFRRKLGEWLFALRGSRPWTRGYHSAKATAIENGINGMFSTERLKAGYGWRIDERVIEYPWMFTCIGDDPARILDAGSVLNFDFILAQPKLSNKSVFISTLWPEPLCFWRQKVSYVYEDLRDSCFRDEYFDVIVCLSTLEHIGLDNTLLYSKDPDRRENKPESYLDAIREFRRMLKPGGKLLLSVPYGAFRNHGWLQVFDARMIEKVKHAFQPSQASAWYFRYRENGWHVATPEECSDATLFDLHNAADYDPDYAASARAVVCLELVR